MPTPLKRSLTTVSRTIRLSLLGTLLLAGPILRAVTPLGTIAVGQLPTSIAVNPATHLAYVVNERDNTVSVFDTIQLKVKKTIAIGTNGVAIAANPPSNMVYVANLQSGNISVITGTGKAASWTVGGQPIALVVDTVLNQLYVADQQQNQIDILDATKGTVLATLSTAVTPVAMAVNLATHAVFVACNGSSASSVIVIDGTRNQILTTVSGASIPTGLTSISVDPATNIVLTVSPTDQAVPLAAIDANDGYSILVEQGDADADPISTAYDAGGFFMLALNGEGYVPCSQGDGHFELGVGWQVPGSGYTELATNPSTNQFGIVSPFGGMYIVDILFPFFQSEVHELTTGKTPVALAFDPVISRVFVVNSGDNTVSAFDVTPRSGLAAYRKVGRCERCQNDRRYSHLPRQSR